MTEALLRIALLAAVPPAVLWTLRRRLPHVPWLPHDFAEYPDGAPWQDVAYLGVAAVAGTVLMTPFWYLALRYGVPPTDVPAGLLTQIPTSAAWLIASVVLAAVTREIPLAVWAPGLRRSTRFAWVWQESRAGIPTWKTKIAMAGVISTLAAVVVGSEADSWVSVKADGVYRNPRSSLGSVEFAPFAEVTDIDLRPPRGSDRRWGVRLAFVGAEPFDSGPLEPAECIALGRALDAAAPGLLLEARADKPALCR